MKKIGNFHSKIHTFSSYLRKYEKRSMYRIQYLFSYDSLRESGRIIVKYMKKEPLTSL